MAKRFQSKHRSVGMHEETPQFKKKRNQNRKRAKLARKQKQKQRRKK